MKVIQPSRFLHAKFIKALMVLKNGLPSIIGAIGSPGISTITRSRSAGLPLICTTMFF